MQPVGVGLHHRTFMSMPRGIASIKKSILSSSFKYEENNSMVAEIMVEYALASTEAANENLGEQALMVFLVPVS